MDILNSLVDIFATYGYIAVFLILIACGFGLPIPEDITLVAGGVICALSSTASHKLNVHNMMLISLFGVLLGDGVMFTLGRFLGSNVTKLPLLNKVITEKNYEIIQNKISKYGDKILFIARFLPGLRAPIFLMSGITHKIHYRKFFMMDGLAALISVPIWVYVGYFFADNLDQVIKIVKQSEVLVFSLLGIIIIGFVSYSFYRKKNK